MATHANQGTSMPQHPRQSTKELLGTRKSLVKLPQELRTETCGAVSPPREKQPELTSSRTHPQRKREDIQTPHLPTTYIYSKRWKAIGSSVSALQSREKNPPARATGPTSPRVGASQKSLRSETTERKLPRARTQQTDAGATSQRGRRPWPDPTGSGALEKNNVPVRIR